MSLQNQKLASSRKSLILEKIFSKTTTLFSAWLATLILIFGSTSINAQTCDVSVEGILTYCNALGNPNGGYYVAFRALSFAGDTLNVVDLTGQVPDNQGKRVDDIVNDLEPTNFSVEQLMIGGGLDTTEYWYFGPFDSGTPFDIALVDPNGQCDTVFIAAGTYDCADNLPNTDPGACEDADEVPLYFLDFSNTEFTIGGGEGGNEDLDEIFLVMSRTRENFCCDLQPQNQSCFEFIVRLGDNDVGLVIDDIGSGSTGGEIYADSLSGFMCTGVIVDTWPFFQGGGQSSETPLCLTGEQRDWIVLSCKSGGNKTSVSIDAITSLVAPPKTTIEPCDIILEVFGADTAIWTSEDDPTLANFASCSADSTICDFLYNEALFGPVTACEGDTFVYIVGARPGSNICIEIDTILYDTTYVVVYPTYDVDIDTMCNVTSDSLIYTASAISAAMGCTYDFVWSNGDTTPSITVIPDGTEYFVTVTRSDLPAETAGCVSAVDSVIAAPVIIPVCTNVQDQSLSCIEDLPDPDVNLVTFEGCGGEPVVFSEDADNGGAGCLNDPLIVTRYYIIDFDGDLINTTSDRDTCPQVFTVIDEVPPTITCAANITIECTDSTAPSNTGTSTATDNCQTLPIVTFADVTVAGNCPQEYSIQRTWTATDACGNTATCLQTITIEDSTPPTITCAANVTIECDESTAPVNTGSSTATDNCDSSPVVTFADVTVAGSCPQEYTIQRTWTATDACGNASTCLQTITVDDSTPPVITCAANVTIECTESTAPSNTGTSTATDNCDSAPLVTFSDVTVAGACPQEYTIQRTWTATDACGNASTCLQTITVDDSTPPVITCAANVTIECTESTAPSNTGTSTATDNCDSAPVVTFADLTVAGACQQEYTIQRTWTAVDACGNASTCLQTITVDDSTPPMMTCAANVTIECTESTDPSNTGMSTATDNCDPNPVLTFNDLSVGADCEAGIERIWTATDACGNSTSCTQLISIEDSTPPTITMCAANVTIECTENTDPSNTGTTTATDNCFSAPVVSFNDVTVAGSCPQEYTITRTWTATDFCGNTSTCVQTITIEDSTPPTITCAANVTIECTESTAPSNTGSSTATDNCDPSPVVTFADITVAGACPQEYTIQRTWTATDACGNASTCIQTITVDDSTPPVLTCAANVTIECTESTAPANTGTSTAVDDCDTAPVVSFADVTVAGNCAQEYTIQRTWTATDACGNASTCLQTITIDDSTPPIITCAANVTIECTDSTAPANTGTSTATDNCDPNPLVTFNDLSVGADCSAGIERVWTATDACGNSVSCTQLISIEDSTPPTITCAADVTVECTESTDPSNTGTSTATDNCFSAPVVTFADVTIDEECPNGYTIQRTWTATDFCGLTSTCGQSIKVEDTTPPTIICPPSDSFECFTMVLIPSIFEEFMLLGGSASDNCGLDTSSFMVNVVADGTNCPLILTITASIDDACGNSDACTYEYKFNRADTVDLALVKELNPGQGIFESGDNVDYTITVINEGNLTVDSITVVDYIPNGMSLNDPDWTSGTSGNTGQSATILLSTLNGALGANGLQPGESVNVEITLQIDLNALSGLYINEAEIFSVYDTFGIDVSQEDIDSNPDDDNTNDVMGEDDIDGVEFCIQSNITITGDDFVCTDEITIYGLTNYNPAATYTWSIQGGNGVIVSTTDSTITVHWATFSPDPNIIEVIETINGIDCGGSASLSVRIQGTSPIACNTHINLSLDSTCNTVVTSGMILSGEGEDADNYFVVLMDEDGNIIPNATLTEEHVGMIIQAKVMSECTNQSCWGTILVEDKLPPVITCPCPDAAGVPTCSVNCVEAEQILAGNIPANLLPVATDGCSTPTLEITGISSEINHCEDGEIVIDWLATDGSGNTATCQQVFIIAPLSLDNLQFPPNVDGECGESTDPSNTGYPTIDGTEIGDSYCNIFVTYWDQEFPYCGGGTKLMRYWTVMDWCTQRTEEGLQIIELGDNAGPVFSCPENMEVSTGFEIPLSDEYGLCYANVSLPVPGATDACQSGPITFDIYVDGSLYATSVVGVAHITELGLGAHTVTWKATDACLNSSTCSFEIRVSDEIAPTVSCDQHTIISLSDDEPFGTTVIDASVFDDGSFDNCSDITFEARRMTTCIDYDWTTNGACIDLEADGNYSQLTDGGMDFKPCVPFACCDVGQGPIMIEVKVKDAAGNENFCMVEIEVQDKLPPTIECPPNIIVSCDFWPNVDDLITGQNLTLDQDPMVSVFGTVIDGFEVQDDESVRQPIIINDPDNDQDAQPKTWGVDGWADDNCDLTLDVRLSFVEDCSGDNLPSDSPEHAVRYFERRFTAVDGQANSISCTQRIWEVDFDPFFISDGTCEDANQNDGVKWPCDEFYTVCPDTIPVNPPIIYSDNCSLIGVTYADERYDLADDACYKIIREWKVIDWCQFDANEGIGSWTYIQTIKVFDSNGPVFANCPTSPVTLCAADAGVNILDDNQVFLGEADPNGSSCSVHVQGSQTVKELCSNSVIYDVKLYMFNASDYVQLVGSTQVATDANGDAVLTFDTETSVDQVIRSNGLPYNDPFCDDYHRIVWTVEDGCGNFSECEYLLRIEDCKPPIPVCTEGLSTVVMPVSGSVTVSADLYNASSIDDCTPSENLLFSFSGDTYQPTREWNCDNVSTFGAQLPIQVWAADGGRDLDCNGQIDWSERNKEFCTTTIVIIDNDGVCGTGNVITGDVMTFESLEPVELTTINLTHPSITFPSVVTVDDGKYEFTNVPLEGPYTITPARNDDHKNGISTLDLVRIQKHLLGVEPLTSPYQFIAADVNNSESISALDLVEIRKLILGIYSEFPENSSWRFVDSKYEFEDLTSPWPFNESIIMENLEALNLEEDFMAVKVGDLNNTVVANVNQVVVRSGREEIKVEANAQALVKSGETFEVEITIPAEMLGFQWTLDLDGLNYIGIESDQVGDDNVGIHDGQVTMSYARTLDEDAVIFMLIFEATKDGRPSDMITVSSDITETEGYVLVPPTSVADSEIEIVDLDLDFGVQNIVEEYALYQNAPNPFTDQTSIAFDLPRAMTASLTITDATGRVIKVIEGEFAAGYNTVNVKLLSGGVYYYNLKAEDFTATKKMIVTK